MLILVSYAGMYTVVRSTLYPLLLVAAKLPEPDPPVDPFSFASFFFFFLPAAACFPLPTSSSLLLYGVVHLGLRLP